MATYMDTCGVNDNNEKQAKQCFMLLKQYWI